MRKALIIGGGIAGPVTAMALIRAGFEATVYEAYDRTAAGVGAYLTLNTNGLQALDALDLRTVVRGLGFETPTIAFSSQTGKKLGEVPMGGTLPDGTVSRTVMRSDLYGALRAEAVERGVRIEYGKQLADAKILANEVIARFADGSQARGIS